MEKSKTVQKKNGAKPEAKVESLHNKPARFINRELSWLQFNNRVLEEAFNTSHPLLERIRFLSISASNLDEFYMVRVAGLKAQVATRVRSNNPDRMTPAQQLKAIGLKATELMTEQRRCLQELLTELRKESIQLVNPADITEQEREWLYNYYSHNIFPILSPIAVDPAHPFPFIPNFGFGLAMELEKETESENMVALVILPNQLCRFIRLQGKTNRLITLEHLVMMFTETLFPSFKMINGGAFRLIRDSEMEIDEKAEDLVFTFESALKRRRRGSVVRLTADEDMADDLLEFIREQLDVNRHDVFRFPGMIGLSNLSELVFNDRPKLLFPVYRGRFPERIRDFGGDCFAAIHSKDILVHHPYESFKVVVQFVQQASEDKNVVSIKQTLYRTNKDSPIVQALIEAAEAGKSVTAMIELRARFDEEANIDIARKLERSGAQVVFGFIDLKTHAKLSLVVRREGTRLQPYAHLGTGNYHPVTAKIYTDLAYFTCDPDVCSDVMQIFNYMTGYAQPANLKKLGIAPLTLRERLMKNIEAEIAFAKAGKPAQIWGKMNSLVDPDIIDAFYNASQAGVQIDLVVRGICSLRPGIPEFSENIRVKSIIGRFLEHSRIFCFGNGYKLPSRHAKLYFSSADLMPRNINRRIESLVPIYNATAHQQVLDQIMVANMRDNEQSWDLQSDGSYLRCDSTKDPFNAHKFFMTNPSLSGMGSALTPQRKRMKRLVKVKRHRNKKKKGS
ncbi:RNA degradosome polyphosphate kinase [Desulfococcaceae bacterium HSG9]|nr:RNA degradosome polyphosphate kinase [Desulfococcaceae bacterium HSG9]